MFTTLHEVLYFLTSSPKRRQVYLDNSASGNGPRLQRMSETRWFQDAECVTQCIDNYTFIGAALKCLVTVTKTLALLHSPYDVII